MLIAGSIFFFGFEAGFSALVEQDSVAAVSYISLLLIISDKITL